MSLPSDASSVSSASASPSELQQQDLSTGLRNEISALPLLIALTGRTDWERSEDKYSEMDYVSHSRRQDKLGLRGRLYGERKGCKATFQTKKDIAYYSSRKNPEPGKERTYNGYVMGWNKINWLIQNKKKAIIFFGFADQTRYIVFDAELFRTFPRGKFQRKSRNKAGDEIDKLVPGIYIPFDRMVLCPFHNDGTPLTQREIDLANGVGCLITDDE